MVKNKTILEKQAEWFVEQNGLDDADSQAEVFWEEVKEALEALESEENEGEEMADVVITLFILAEIMDIDLHKEYVRKMEYNLQKSGKQDENGKVIDDV